MGFRYLVRSYCVVVACASLLANFLPPAKWLKRWPRTCHVYTFLVDVVAFVALNLRLCLPSLQQEFLGFRRSMGKRVRAMRSQREVKP